jgi:hypothetical protein
LLAAGACVALALLGLPTMAFTDYEAEAEPALQALRDGRLGEFLDLAPAYGGSLILRSPFAVLPNLWGGGDLALFRSMAVPCLAAGASLGVVLWIRSRAEGAGRGTAAVVLLVCAANPITLRALEIGHPEELLGAVLCVGAVLAGGARRPVLAGVLLGLAIANKPWAVLAAVPVALALGTGMPYAKSRAAAAAFGVASAVLVPFALAGGAAIEVAADTARTSGEIFQPWQVWWFVGDHAGPVFGLFGEKPGYRTPPGWIADIARPLVVLVPLVLSLVYAVRRRSQPWHDALLLLAVVFLLRCVLDPWNISYYAIPFLLSLVAWEVHARRGVPLLTLGATLLTWASFEELTRFSPDAQAVFYLAWSVPFAIALAWRLLDPAGFARRSQPAAALVRRRVPVLAARLTPR